MPDIRYIISGKIKFLILYKLYKMIKKYILSPRKIAKSFKFKEQVVLS